MQLKTLFIRTLSGAVFVSIVVGAVLLSQKTAALLFLIFTIIGLYEFYSNLNRKGFPVQIIPGIIAGILAFSILGIIGFSSNYIFLLGFFVPILFALLAVELYRKKENPFTNIALTVLGILYIAIPFGMLSLFPILRNNQYEPMLVLSIFILTWSNDTFAYLVGVGIGKHRLFERHSPKKSWEGFIGGVVFSVGTSILLYYLSPCSLRITDWIIMAVIISVIGTLGDLIESMFKRSLQIKDSGSVMPGHGGILDRFDSILFSTPFIFCYLLFLIF